LKQDRLSDLLRSPRPFSPLISVGFHQDNIEYSLELLSETVILFAYKYDNAKVAMCVSPAAHEVLPLEESDLALFEEDGDRVYIAPARMRGFLGEICLPELDIDCLGDIQKQDISYGNYLFDVTLSSTLITGANDGVIFDVRLSRERMEPWV